MTPPPLLQSGSSLLQRSDPLAPDWPLVSRRPPVVLQSLPERGPAAPGRLRPQPGLKVTVERRERERGGMKKYGPGVKGQTSGESESKIHCDSL